MKRNFNLGDHLPYLLNRAGVKIGNCFNRDIARYDITLPVWRVLVALWQHDEQSLSELSEITSIDVSTLSRLVVNMETKKLVVRRRSGKDARALSLSLTRKGEKLTEQIVPIAQFYEASATTGISEADIRRLKSLLSRIYSNMKLVDAGQAVAKRMQAAE